MKKYPQFLTIVDTCLKDENFDYFKDEYTNRLILMNYRVAYKVGAINLITKFVIHSSKRIH